MYRVACQRDVYHRRFSLEEKLAAQQIAQVPGGMCGEDWKDQLLLLQYELPKVGRGRWDGQSHCGCDCCNNGYNQSRRRYRSRQKCQRNKGRVGQLSVVPGYCYGVLANTVL